MKQGTDIVATFPGIVIIHQKIRGYSVDRHHHEDEHELFLPLQGEIRLQIGGGRDLSELRAGPGKMIYLPAGAAHAFDSSTSSQGERLIFLLSKRAWKSNGGGTHPAAAISASQLSKELLFHLLLHPRTKAAPALIGTLVQTISESLETSGMQTCGKAAHLRGLSSDPRVARALETIESHFDDSLSADALARRSGMSVRTLNRLFLAELGMTPKQVATLHRMERAKTLLREGRLSVTDVALEVGYSSISQFITTFRKITGQLPSEFR